MAKPITIRELSAYEVSELLTDKIFGKLKPESCARCGAKTGFTRRIFEIRGVGKRKQADNETQGVIGFHFKQRYAIDSIFFKTNPKKFFVDSAICSGCGSTAIVYDIELDQDLIYEIAKLTGRSEAEVRTSLEKAYNKLCKD